jgi:hypothetical protein
VEHVHVRIAGERRPTEKVPGVVKGRPWERQHRRFWDPVQPEILPGLLYFFAGMSRHDGLDDNA